MKEMRKPETIIILWFVTFATTLVILTLEFKNYSIDIRTTTAALLTIPFVFSALHKIQKS